MAEVAEMGLSDLFRFEKYLMGYASSKVVRESARERFYDLVAAVDAAKAHAPVDTAAGQVGSAANEKTPHANGTGPVNGAKTSQNIHSLMEEILEEENLAQLLAAQEDDEEDSEEESSHEPDPELVNHFVPRNFMSFADAPEESEPMEERPVGHKRWESLWQREDGAVEGMEDEEMEGMEIDLDYADVQAKLPPYFLMSKKNKKRFFRGLTEEFKAKVVARRSSRRIKKVTFNEKANQVVTFFKDAKLETLCGR